MLLTWIKIRKSSILSCGLTSTWKGPPWWLPSAATLDPYSLSSCCKRYAQPLRYAVRGSNLAFVSCMARHDDVACIDQCMLLTSSLTTFSRIVGKSLYLLPAGTYPAAQDTVYQHSLSKHSIQAHHLDIRVMEMYREALLLHMLCVCPFLPVQGLVGTSVSIMQNSVASALCT